MRRFLALSLALVFAFGLTACNKDNNEDTSSLPSQVTTESELENEVDFDNADFSNGTDGEVYVQVPEVKEETTSSIEETIPPDEVWENIETGASLENFNLPEEVMLEGSLGTLTIPKIQLNVPIYETDDEMEAMVNGIAHFKETSCWNGNVGLAGHNQGVNEYFGELHTLVPGDVILFETALGKRTYEVIRSFEISETDWSVLDRKDENMITMITCVNHDLTKRLCVQAVEV